MARPRIAILNAYWSVHPSIGYMAEFLERAGWSVDIFLLDSDESLSGSLIKTSANVRVQRLDQPAARSNRRDVLEKRSGLARVLTKVRPWIRHGYQLFRRFVRSAKDEVLLRIDPERGLIPRGPLEAVLELSAKKPYDVLLGVEKTGLAWAGAVAAVTKTPLAYYSLELYTRNHPWVACSAGQRRIKAVEEKYHRECALTIIQDEYRARVLFLDNQIKSRTRVAYFPICVPGGALTHSSTWLQTELGLSADTIVIIVYGAIAEQRRFDELAQAAQVFPETWRLVLHGYGQQPTIDKIRALDRAKRILFSLRLVRPEERHDVVRSAKVGLVIYNAVFSNDRLTGRSSEKVATYLQCGIPLVAFREESYEHIEEEKCGILVDRMEQIPDAIAQILSDYANYVRNAYASYRRHYCFEDNFKEVLDGLKSIVKPGRVDTRRDRSNEPLPIEAAR